MKDRLLNISKRTNTRKRREETDQKTLSLTAGTASNPAADVELFRARVNSMLSMPDLHRIRGSAGFFYPLDSARPSQNRIESDRIALQCFSNLKRILRMRLSTVVIIFLNAYLMKNGHPVKYKISGNFSEIFFHGLRSRSG